ncbi:barstar family protein [Flavobacterium cerinum]|uniref:Barstar (barnase inhibitor) domain-containing protein n=1 Tax=Flavobacterium cerinum TaxID=2502784 RepID=A0A3S3RLM7_9FLAO|nr:barstar family protein [Flavobacterium cerinum]RWX03705.1 hypothetical protein EPI11_01895 [Flavobacterium cerinum]
MFKFENNPKTWERIDYQIISRGFVKAYSDDTILKANIGWFEKENYKTIEFDCIEWNNDKEIMHDHLSLKLDFPPYYGKNWDALDECLNDLEIPENGLVVVFKNLDLINIKTAHTLINCFVSSAQTHILFNERLLALIKVENQKFELPPLGAITLSYY